MLKVQTRPTTKTLALVGAPNVGKSALFSRLTGRYAACSNYPGTTVESFSGELTHNGERWSLVDTPGMNDMAGASEDVRAARQALAGGVDAICQVGDATNPQRTLSLFLQLAELGLPMVLALNLSDERRACGLELDVQRLSERLGVPVVETVAITGEGVEALKAALAHARRARVHSDPEPNALPLQGACADCVPYQLAVARGRVVERLLEGVVLRTPHPADAVAGWSMKLSRWTTHPVFGVFILLAVLFAMYQFVGVLGAQVLVGWLEEDLFAKVVNPALIEWAQHFVPFIWLQEMLVGEYGIFTMAITYAIALILPIVTTFFLAFGFLEDSGYFPRLTVMAHRAFRRMGLSGQAVLPMILGLGCDTMATVSARILETRKERVIATLLLALGVPCSAQLAVLLAMSAASAPWMLPVVLTVVGVQMLVVGRLASKLLPGESAAFVMELPPLRLPRFENIFKKTLLRLRWYATEVVPLFVIGTMALFILDKLGALAALRAAAQPVVEGLLGLPGEATNAFVMGFFRRDYGAAGLYSLQQAGQLDIVQVLVSLVVITLFVPCIANVLVIARERGWRVALGIVAFVMPYAFLVGALVNAVARWIARS